MTKRANGMPIALAVLILIGATMSARWATHTKAVVTGSLLAAALQPVPRAETASDIIAFYEDRLQKRGDRDPLAVGQLVDAYLRRFKVYGDKEDLDRAKTLLDIRLANEPDDPRHLATLASIHLSEHRFGDAVSQAQKAVTLGDEHPEGFALLSLVDALFAHGEVARAAHILDSPLVDRGSMSFLMREARLKKSRGDLAGARKSMRQVLAQARAFAQPAEVLAWCHIELGHIDNEFGNVADAAAHYMKGLEYSPGYPEALEGLASIALDNDNNLGVAGVLYKRALAHGGHLDIYAKLYEIERRLGRLKAAEEYKTTFVRLATSSQDVERLFYRPLAILLADADDTIAAALEYAQLDVDNRPTQESRELHKNIGAKIKE